MELPKITAKIRFRRGSYSEWQNSNPVLDVGEVGFITSGQDVRKLKVGDGVTAWNNLSFCEAKFPEDIIQLEDQNASNTPPTVGNIKELFQTIRNYLKWETTARSASIQSLSGATSAALEGHNNDLNSHPKIHEKFYGALDIHNTNSNAHADIRGILNYLIGMPKWDADTHTIKFTARDGGTMTIDLPLESLTQDISYDPETKEIIIIKQDNTQLKVSVADLVDVYTGSMGDHIQIVIEPENVIKAVLRGGSIGPDKVSPEFHQMISNVGKVVNAVTGNLVSTRTDGGLIDSGKSPDDFTPAWIELQSAVNDLEPPPDHITRGTVAVYIQIIWNKISGIFNMLTKKVNIAGDSMLGALNFKGGRENLVGDNVSFGSGSQAGVLAIKGKNGDVEILLKNPMDEFDNASGFRVKEQIMAKMDKVINLGSVDFNSVTTPGNYIITNNNTNAPTTSGSRWLVFVWGEGNYLIQEAFYYSSGAGSGVRWWRKRENGTWLGWQRVVTINDLQNLTDDYLKDILKMNTFQTGNLLFTGNWTFSSNGVLTKDSNADCRIISIPVDKKESTSGHISWIDIRADWPTIIGLGDTPSITGGGKSITIPEWTAIIGRHQRGGNYTAVNLYALSITQSNANQLLQPGDVFLCSRSGESGSQDKLQLGNGMVIGGGVSIVNGGLSGMEGLSIWSTNTQLTENGTKTNVVPIAVPGRTVKVGDIVISNGLCNVVMWGRVTAVASQTSVTVVHLSSIRDGKNLNIIPSTSDPGAGSALATGNLMVVYT